MGGDIIWDSISRLDFYLTQGSTLTDAVIQDERYAGSGGEGYTSLYLDSDSKWVVTGDSTLTNLQCGGTIVDTDGNTVSIVGTDGTVYVSGDSSYTITVSSPDCHWRQQFLVGHGLSPPFDRREIYIFSKKWGMLPFQFSSLSP